MYFFIYNLFKILRYGNLEQKFVLNKNPKDNNRFLNESNDIESEDSCTLPDYSDNPNGIDLDSDSYLELNYPCQDILDTNFEIINDQVSININRLKLIGSGGFGTVIFYI